MIKEYTYHVKYSENKEAYLKDNNIPYDVLIVMNKIRAKIWFIISSSMENYETIIKDFETMGDKYSRVDVYYNEQELEKCEFLLLHANKQSIDILNEDNFVYLCQYPNEIFGGMSYNHKVQTREFVIRKEPSTKKRTAFWFNSTGWNYMFADYRVKSVIEYNNLKGIKLRDVYLKNGKKSEILFQVDAPTRLKDEDLIFDKDVKIVKCPKCGKKQYVLHGDEQIHLNSKKIDLSMDLFITDTIFGDMAGVRRFIISQKFYQLLKKYNLTGGLSIEPVIIERSL